jgi:ubiquinone/menaquinone biosynthesis C-methylase UbiE
MKNYFIKTGYIENKIPQSLDHVSGQAFWDEKYIKLSHAAQYYIYQYAYQMAKEQHIKQVLDIGCGVGTMLKHFFKPEEEFQIFGVDQPSAVEYCRKKIPNGTFIEDFLESPTFQLKNNLAVAPLIISADVIEHLLDPDKLLDYIKKFSDHKTLIILSTPERDAVRGKNSMQANNPYHVREWNFDEFHEYISHSGFKILEHKMMFSNKLNFDLETIRWLSGKIIGGLPFKHAQMVLCQKKQ